MQLNNPKMLVFLVIVVALGWTAAEDFLENCPIDRKHRLDDNLVVDVLHTFYQDLSFVRASTESRQSRHYNGILQELREEITAADVRQPIEEMVESLMTGEFVESLSNTESILWNRRHFFLKVRSYFHYFKAEAYRLVGNNIEARDHIFKATALRHLSPGISVNELEKLDGLLTIQRVSQFNQDVDKLYGLRKGPSFEYLRRVHSTSKDDIEPFGRSRWARLRTMFRSNQPIIQSLREREIGLIRAKESTAYGSIYMRINPEQDDFSGHSIATISVEEILCEFARKLAILGTSSRDTTSTGYDSLVGQLRQIDLPFAEEFNERVVRNMENKNQFGAWNSIANMEPFSSSRVEELNDDAGEHVRSLKTFAKYFIVEIYLGSINNCSHLSQAEKLLKHAKRMRETLKGVSLGKILELEGRVVFLSLNCLHQRLRSIYALNGNEIQQDREAKRIRFGACETISTQPPFE